MATFAVVATEVPTELAGLVVSRKYSIQNISVDAVIFIAAVRAGDPPPVPGDPAFELVPKEGYAGLTLEPDETWYLWAGKGTAKAVLEFAL